MAQGRSKSGKQKQDDIAEKSPGFDAAKRNFLKIAGVAGLGLVAASVLPKQASAYVAGSTPTSSVVGVKDSSNTRIDPATESTLQSVVSGQGVTKITTGINASGAVYTPTSGKRVRVYSTRFTLDASIASVAFRFGASGQDYEKYLSVKTGGLYGSNNHPNFVEGGVDESVYCVLSGAANVQINIDYLEV